MTDADLKLMAQYTWLIPNHPIVLGQVIEQISKKYNAVQIEYGDIPHLWMHRYNAVHLPKNEELRLAEEQLKIKAIKIPINEQVAQYIAKDFTPVLCRDGEANFIYLAYEEQVSEEEPFHILSYADEPLSWGDEKQCRELYEKAIYYYDNQ